MNSDIRSEASDDEWRMLEDGSIAHIIRGCSSIEEAKAQALGRHMMHVEAAEQLQRSYGLLSALTQEYHTIWLVDKETLKMRLVRSSGVSTIKGAVQLGKDYPDFDTAFAKYIDTYVEPEDRERMRLAIHSSEVLKQIEQNSLYTVNYLRRDESGHAAFHQIAFANADNGDVKQFAYAFRDVDKLIKEDAAKKQEMQEAREQAEEKSRQLAAQLDIIQTIAKTYNCIYYVDMSDYSFTELGANLEGVHEIIGVGGDARDAFERMYKFFVLPEQIEDVRKFTDITTLNERLKDREWISYEFCGQSNGWSEGIFVAAGRDAQGNCEHAIWATRNINNEKQEEERLTVQSNTDALTGLYNRRAYENAITKYSNLTNANLVYVSVDVNGLKDANDNIGHSAGDELIIGAADCLKKCLDRYGRLFRIGGDEFAALIFADRRQLTYIKKRIEKLTESWHGTQQEHLSLSCGYVCKRDFPELSIHDIAVLADKRMYEAKALYYRSRGIDRRSQRDAFTVLRSLYTKILKINLTDDDYRIINMDMDEQTEEMGFKSSISAWLKAFGMTGQVHPDDLAEYLRRTDLDYMRSYFKKTGQPLNVFYRRKYGDSFRHAMMEIVPSSDYSDDAQVLFLYVKDIDSGQQ